MIAALCSKCERVNEPMAKWFRDSGSSIYIFLDDLPSQTGVCLKKWQAMKNSSETSQFACAAVKEIGLPLANQNHWEALTVAEASRDFHVSLHVVYVDYDVLLCEFKLSESIAVVIGMEGMASVRRNVRSLNSSLSR